MIIDPDFLGHWKCELLRTRLDDPAAPLYVLRLWGHCQQRKTDRITNASPAKLAAICEYRGDSEAFWQTMHLAEWVQDDGADLIAHGWAERNAGLLSAWDNGRKGGRPPAKKPPTEHGQKPPGNPQVTQGKPTGNPPLTGREPIREDKIREDQTGEEPQNAGASTHEVPPKPPDEDPPEIPPPPGPTPEQQAAAKEALAVLQTTQSWGKRQSGTTVLAVLEQAAADVPDLLDLLHWYASHEGEPRIPALANWSHVAGGSECKLAALRTARRIWEEAHAAKVDPLEALRRKYKA